MTGAQIVGALLREDVTLTEIVAETSIQAGRLPDGVGLPALLVRTVDMVERQPLERGATVHCTERVSVTARARNYREQIAVIAAVRRCCAGWRGAMPGAERIAILTAGTGPDLNGPGDSFEQTQDFRVSFDAPA